MPAIKKPVIKRKAKREFASFAHHATDELQNAPSNELIKNNLTGEKRSANERKAKTSVPDTKPSITAEVIWLTAYWLKCKDCFNSGKTALPTNHNDVPANCDNTINGKIYLGLCGK